MKEVDVGLWDEAWRRLRLAAALRGKTDSDVSEALRARVADDYARAACGMVAAHGLRTMPGCVACSPVVMIDAPA